MADRFNRAGIRAEAVTSRTSGEARADLFDLADYIAEVRVPEGSAVIGKRIRELDDLAEQSDIEIIGLTRRGRRLPGLARIAKIEADDILVIEASPESLDEALGALQLEYVGKSEGVLEDGDLDFAEVLVPETSRLAGRSAVSLRMLYRYRVALVGVSRAGKRFRENVRKLELKPGDVLVASTQRSIRTCLWGELLSTASVARGANGAVIDGYTRDVRLIQRMQFPVFSSGMYPVDSAGRGIVIDYNITINCGGVLVRPGDIIFGDIDGVVVIPQNAAREVIERAVEKVKGENITREALKNGATLREVYEKYGVL